MNLVPFPKQDEPEQIFTRATLAAYLHVSTKTVDRYVKDGMPSELWGPRTRRFRLADVNPWLRKRAA